MYDILLSKNVLLKKIYHLSPVLTIYQMFLKLTQLKTVWTVLKRKIYENNWEAKSIHHMVKRIKRQIKEFDRETLQGMMKSVRKKLRVMA